MQRRSIFISYTICVEPLSAAVCKLMYKNVYEYAGSMGVHGAMLPPTCAWTTLDGHRDSQMEG